MKRQRRPLKQTTLSSFVNKRPCPNGAVKPESDSGLCENTPPCANSSAKVDSPIHRKPRSPLQEINFDFDDDDGFGDDWTQFDEIPLKFDAWIKCTVIESQLTTRPYEKHVQVSAGNRKGRFVLRQMWAFNLDLSPGDVVGVKAALLANTWVIDAQNGFVSLDPDNLISSTSLVGAMFCRRKGVLSTVFKELDANNRVMTIGNLVHEIFQKALLLKECTRRAIDQIMVDLLAQPATIRMLFTCDMTLEDTKKELKTFIPQILKIIQTFITRELQPEGRNFRGAITDIVDIEESVASQCIGIKGRIDVTAETRNGGVVKRVPLEVKTGRASFSSEHRSQVIMYTMLLNELGHCSDSGLLVYVREGIVEEITANHMEMRDLILLRNEFVQYIRRFDPNSLPEPIRQINACRKCSYLSVCSAYAGDRMPKTEIDSNHVEYFRRWSSLLLLEDQVDGVKNTNLVMDVTLLSESTAIGKQFVYRMKREPIPVGFTPGNFIRITPKVAKKFNASCFGYLGDISDTECSVVIDRPLIETDGCLFVIEGYRSTMLSRHMSNLAMLLEPRFEKLRKMVIDREFCEDVVEIPRSLLDDTAEIVKGLNKEQQRSVLRALGCKDYLLVQGPPGTGKTQTIVAMVKAFVATKRSVLLTGHSHSAVDNILLRLNGLPFLRLGNLTNIDARLHDRCYGKRIEDVKSEDELRDLLMATPVIATTCLGFDTDLAMRRKFDVCIVDESSQVLQPELLKPLFACETFVLVGDSKQLQPVVRSVEARKLGLGESLFERLDHSKVRVTLTQQYRMNSVIMDMANKLMYDGVLKTGSVEVSTAVIKTRGTSCGWLERITSPCLNDSLLFIDTSESFAVAQNASSSNTLESKLVARIVNELLKRGLKHDQIGVMAPYRDQVMLLKSAIAAGVEVNTVDQYQGRDKDCIILSCTKQNRATNSTNNELLDDDRRLSVAVTRAKHKLLLVGDRTTLITRYKPFEKFFQFLDASNLITLKNNVNGFSWDSL